MRAGQDLEGMYVFTLAYCGFGTVNGGFMQTYSDVDQDISRTHCIALCGSFVCVG